MRNVKRALSDKLYGLSVHQVINMAESCAWLPVEFKVENPVTLQVHAQVRNPLAEQIREERR